MVGQFSTPIDITKGIEVYPQAKQPFRLPFGVNQRPILENGGTLDSLEEKLYWFEKLDDFDLAAVPRTQGHLNLFTQQTSIITSKRIGMELLEHGLQSHSTRNQAQFEILYSLWRQNVPIGEAIQIAWSWIQKRHNGFSKDILQRPRAVAAEIKRQAAKIYNSYDLSKTFPDSTHNSTHGYISKLDLQNCIEICKGSLPKLKFLTELVRYCNPRRHRDAIQVHSDKLQAWSSKAAYMKRIVELEEAGIIQRNNSYKVGANAKAIKLNWKWQPSNDAVLFDDRSVTPYDSFKHSFTPEEFRERLTLAGAKRTTAIEAVKSVY